MASRTDRLAAKVRAICAGLPEVEERPSHSAPTWFVRGKKSFVMLWASGHHDHEFPHLWCAAPAGTQEELVAEAVSERGAAHQPDPPRFFRPPYVGHRGWLGVRLDGPVDWAEIEELCRDAFRTVAPKTLAAQLDD